ncbi:hypothetical protein GCM10017783_09030 [Deinococcus piscis]|uniref:DUF11 domain-containing protein n=1 Tax=Deinococcus piscis TaxID=394230 RepID=A0ABQ3K123_9DEIO|nr:DUF11 domain-containing protein [Deinococcus piscis]GHF99234.1 hypothetical protein GCM10017783_09030 [Deinococcus piscis]
MVATLPQGNIAPKVGQAVAEWAYLPPYCKAGSSLSIDKQTLTCVIGDVSATSGTGTTSLVMDARVLSGTPNGTALPAPVMTVTSTSSAAPAPSSLPPTVTVSAAPFYDVVIDNSYQGNPKAYAYNEAGGPNNEEGFYHRPLVGLVARNPNGNGRKGVEQLATSVDFKLDVSGYPAGVRVDNWHTGTGVAGTPAASGSFQDGCGSPSYGTPSGGSPSSESGAAVNMYGKVADIGPATGVNTATVPNGGDCAVVSSDATAVNLKVTGADTSLTRRPTVLAGTGASIPQRDWWIMNKALVLWTPLTSYPAGVKTLNTLKLGTYSAKSITGQEITGDNPGNNQVSYDLTATNSGVASKIFTKDTTRPYPYGTECDPALTGNCLTNFMAPGQTVGSVVRYANEGTYRQSNVYMCDVIDRTAFDIGPNFQVSFMGLSGQVRYGARSSRYFASTDASDTSNRTDSRTAPNTPTVLSDYSSAKCDDPAIRWFSTAAEAEAAGGLVYVRADLPSVSGGTFSSLYIYGLTLRSTYAATINVLSGATGTRVAGQPLTEGTLIRNTADFGGTGVSAVDQSVFWDNLQVVPIKTRSGVTKTVLDPAANPVSAGAVLTYQIQPTYTTTFPPLARNFTVTDILPPGLSYVPGSSTVGGVGREPTISADTPAAGFTRLTWVYPNQLPYVLTTGNDSVDSKLPPVVFKASVSPTATNNSTLTNSAAVSGGPDDYEADCTYNVASTSYGACVKSSSVSRTVQSAPGLKLSKSTPTSLIEPGQPFKFTLSYVSVGTTVTARDLPDLIDILPYNGDGTSNPARSFTGRTPASSFAAGTYQLQSVTRPSNDPAMTVYYTKAAPSTISNDPQDASNAPGGSTVWCTALSGNLCPANMSEVTAVRLHPTVMNADTTYSVDLNFQTTAAVKPADIFNNSVAMRPTDPASTLLYLESQSLSAVRVAAASLGGRVFEDVNQNGGFDGADRGLGEVCMVLTGTTNSGSGVTYSMFTQADGTYIFGAGAGGALFPSSDCTGTAIPSFGGLQSGTYAVKELTQPAGYLDGKDYAGTAGGTPGNDQVTGIALGVGASAQGYNFTEVRALLKIGKAVDLRYIGITADPSNDTNLTYAPASQQLTYTFLVTNSSAVAVENAVVADALPQGLSYVSSSIPAAVDAAGKISFNLDRLNAGESREITLTVKADVQANTNQQPFLNTATVTANGLTPVLSEEVRTDLVYTKLTKRVQHLGTAPGPSVPQLPANWKTETAALPGEVLEYCIDFYNYGSVALSNYELRDSLPTYTRFVSDSWVVREGSMTNPGGPLAGASITASDQALQVNIASLPPSSRGTFCFRVMVH